MLRRRPPHRPEHGNRDPRGYARRLRDGSVQNALAQVSLKGAPFTAVMTTNVTRFMMDLGEVLLGRDPDDVARACRRANHTWPAIVGFAIGCSLGAAGEAAFELWSLAV